MFDKYAVVIEEDDAKVASAEGRTCPSCGSDKVNYSGMTPHCPRCGTRPWEVRKDGEREDYRR